VGIVAHNSESSGKLVLPVLSDPETPARIPSTSCRIQGTKPHVDNVQRCPALPSDPSADVSAPDATGSIFLAARGRGAFEVLAARGLAAFPDANSAAARRITAFPYSRMSHPMIVGNVLAFGGTLLNPEFRAAWWPLAALHVVLNLALLAMERAGPGRRPAIRLAGVLVLAVTAATATVADPRQPALNNKARNAGLVCIQLATSLKKICP
jgi:hypothetical protein